MSLQFLMAKTTDYRRYWT